MKFKGKDKAKGITLIALVITIIIMLILAGVSINAIVGDNGIITRSMEASFKAAVSQYKEEIETYIITAQASSSDLNLSVYAGDIDLNTIYYSIFEDLYVLLSGGISNVDISSITSIEEDDYKSHLGVEANTITWYTDDASSNEVQWCLDLGIQVYVEGYGYMGTDGSWVIYSEGTFAKHGSSWYCEPDLSGFSTGNTYYITYSSDNTTMTQGDKIYNETPSGWYDYENQEWANVVTVANQHLSYWVWIPRYAYKVTNSTDATSAATDILFINTDNQYADSSGNLYDIPSGYAVADAFTYGGEELSGIWVSKYEISDPKEPTGFSVQLGVNSITVYDITWEGESDATDTDLYNQVQGAQVTIQYQGANGDYGTVVDTLPCTIDNLASDTTYTLTVETPTYGINSLTMTKTVSTLEGEEADLTAPDLTGFSEDNTYFVTYNTANTTATIGSKIVKNTSTEAIKDGRVTASNAPSDWYDYSNQRWANLLTVDHDTGEAAYWVWIPRYEYYVDTDMKICDIIFISANKTEADEGYEIPDAFTYGDEELSGIWVMKYELTDVMVASGMYTSVTSSSIEITNIVYGKEDDGTITYEGANTVTSGSLPNQAYVTIKDSSGNTVSGYDGSTLYTIGSISSKTVSVTGLTAGESYTVTLKVLNAWTDPTNTNTEYVTTVEETITLPNSTKTASTPDVSGFVGTDTCYVYPVIFSSTSTAVTDATLGSRIEKDTVVSNITGWYDYSNQYWANILVSDKDLSGYSTVGSIDSSINVNMFVWIPKYEYSFNSNTGTTTVIMLGSGDSADSGYTIPDAFTFGNTTLSGFWVAKYSIDDPTADSDYRK